jgi:hypothetical protein
MFFLKDFSAQIISSRGVAEEGLIEKVRCWQCHRCIFVEVLVDENWRFFVE